MNVGIVKEPNTLESAGSGLVIQHSRSKAVSSIRPIRLEVPGGLYHVASWGDRREAV